MSIQEQFEAIGRQHGQGATIGDGMKASAKTAAWLGGFTLLLNSAPCLVPLIAACLFFFRSCSVTPPVASAPSEPRLIQPAFPDVPASTTITQSQPAILQAIQAPPPQITPHPEPMPPEPAVEPTPSHAASPEANNDAASEPPSPPEQPIASSEPHAPNFSVEAWIEEQAAAQARGGNTSRRTTGAATNANRIRPNLFTREGRQAFTQRDFYDRIYLNPFDRRFQRGQTSRPIAANQPTGLLGRNATSTPIYDASGIYEAIAGSTYVGTCQLPDQPSKRCKLTIKLISDRGTNIDATMSLLSGSMLRKFTGFVHGDELTLNPKLGRRESQYGFPTAWYGNKPRRIRLTLQGDGKTLSGKADVSGETFELVPSVTNQPSPAGTALPTLKSMDNGEELTWSLVSHNSKPVSDVHLWQFKQTTLRKGAFSWLDGDTVKLSGTYRLAAVNSRSISLMAGEGDGSKTYRCQYRLDHQSGHMNLWIPKKSSKPAKADPANDHLFTLEFLQ